MDVAKGLGPKKKDKRDRRIWVALGLISVIVTVAVAAVLDSPSRAKSEITSMVVVSTSGAYSSHVVPMGSILNDSLIFYSGEKIGVRIALTYLAFPGDPNSLEITSVNDSDGMTVLSTTPSLPARLTGSPQGIAITVYLAAPSSSYAGDLHLNVASK